MLAKVGLSVTPKLVYREPHVVALCELSPTPHVTLRSEWIEVDLTEEQLAVLALYSITDLEGGAAIASATPWHPYILQAYTNLR